MWITTNWKILKEMGIPDHLTCLLRNLYAGQETRVRSQYGTMDWFKPGKGVLKAVYCHPACLTYMQSTLRNWKQQERAGGSAGKESTCNARERLQRRRPRFDPWVRKVPWRRKQQPTPVFLSGKFHGQRRVVGYSPWGRKSRTRLSTKPRKCAESGGQYSILSLHTTFQHREYYSVLTFHTRVLHS